MSDNDKPYIGIKLSKDVESPESLDAEMEAARARLAELAQDRSIMERWDDFLMGNPIAASAIAICGLLVLGGMIGLLAMLDLVVSIAVVALLVAGLVFAITR